MPREVAGRARTLRAKKSRADLNLGEVGYAMLHDEMRGVGAAREMRLAFEIRGALLEDVVRDGVNVIRPEHLLASARMTLAISAV